MTLEEIRAQQAADLEGQRAARGEDQDEMLERLAREPDPKRLYRHKIYEEYRARFLARFRKCWYCGKPSIALHHFNGDHENDAPGNHAAVCVRCHAAITRKGNYWHPRLRRRMLPAEIEKFLQFAERKGWK
jgi:hypothetical protein